MSDVYKTLYCCVLNGRYQITKYTNGTVVLETRKVQWINNRIYLGVG